MEADMKARQRKERGLDQAGEMRLGAMLPSPDCQIAIEAAIVKSAWIMVPLIDQRLLSRVEWNNVTDEFLVWNVSEWNATIRRGFEYGRRQRSDKDPVRWRPGVR